MLKISFGTRFDMNKGISPTNGYGYATKCMLESLDRLGYHVDINDSSADVEIWFDQPHWWKFSKGPYKIGYHPWESTLLISGWSSIMNKCDEIWTPSDLIADWYKRYNNITVPVFVYEHGIEHEWAPVRRDPEKLKFLHVGADDTRKGYWDTAFPAFRKAFPQRGGRELTCKTTKSTWNTIGSMGGINYNNEKLSFDALLNLYYDHDVYVYPSWGEGFGLTPLQAMATGMPTITVPGWAPYRRFLDPSLEVGHEMVETPAKWRKIHPGKMMKPSINDTVKAMQYVDENYEAAVDYAMKMADEIHKAYDWDKITSRVFGDLEARLK